jgi:hypothetical protein
LHIELGLQKKTASKQTASKKTCTHCYTVIAKGIHHICNDKTRLENVKAVVQRLCTKRGQGQVISSLLKDKVKEMASTSKSVLLDLPTHSGKSLRVSINPPKNREALSADFVFSADTMQRMKTTLNFSQNETIRVASVLRSAAKKRNLIEPKLREKLSTNLHCVDKYFDVKSFDFTIVKADQVSTVRKEVVYCKDLNGLIKFVKDERKVLEVHLKFGIDGGGGFLKLNLSIQSTVDQSIKSSNRQRYKDGVAFKTFRDTGVKRLFILGIVQGGQENYENVFQLWSAIGINAQNNSYESTIATDLKLANIMSGLMTHSSLHPCTWCIAEKGKLDEKKELRTIGNIITNYSNWMDTGGSAKSAKNYLNCIHRPVFFGENDELILDIIPPPELHLMLGVVNTLFNHMASEFSDAAWEWAKACNVERDVTNGGTGFNGNSCKTLLNKIDILRSGCPIGCLKFVRTFDNFRLVVKACFSTDLDPQYATHINNFKNSYLDLDVPVTPKVHSVFFHVEEFCSKNQRALGFYSEQAMESVHYEFKKFWEKHKVKETHTEYSKHLLNAVCEFNSSHI